MNDNHLKVDHLLKHLMGVINLTTSTLSLGDILNRVVQRIQEMMSVDACTIRQLENGYLSIGAASGYSDSQHRQHPIPVDGRLSNSLLLQKPIVVNDIEQSTEVAPSWKKRAISEGFRSFLGVPMSIAGKATGMMSFYSRTKRRWTETEINLSLTVAGSIALIIEKVENYQNSLRALRHTSLLLDISNIINQSISAETSEKFISQILQKSLTAIGVTRASCYMRLESKWKLIAHAEKNFPVDFFQKDKTPQPILDKTINEKLSKPDITYTQNLPWLSGTAQIIDDLADARSILLSPIVAGVGRRSLIIFDTPNEWRHWDEDTIELANGIANHVGMALRNRKLVEELDNSRRQYQHLFEDSVTPMAIVSNRGTIVSANNRFTEISGYTRGDIENTIEIEDIFQRNGYKKTPTNSRLRTPERKLNDGEAVLIMKNKTQKNVLLQSAPLEGDSNKLYSIIDISEYKTLQRRLFESEHLAKIGQCTAALAHEIRNPLTAMTTAADALKQTPNLSKNNQDMIDILTEEAVYLKKILENFVKYASPKPLELNTVNINDLVKETVSLLEPQAPQNTKIELSLEDPIPQIQLDPKQLSQVIINLILNAFEAMENGGILHVSTNSRSTKDRNEIQMTISDTGAGIPFDVRKDMFKPFFTTKDGGTGLGLTICKKIIESHGGSIEASNGKHGGTKFTVNLPLFA